MFMLFFFFFNDTATTEIYTLSLHDALPISVAALRILARTHHGEHRRGGHHVQLHHGRCASRQDRKSTRLNSSHANISYAVFCLKKKKDTNHQVSRQHGTAQGRTDDSAYSPS